MPEAVTGTGESQPADDIRSALASAFADSERPEPELPLTKPAAKVIEAKADVAEVGAETADAMVDGDDSAVQRARGPDGKFAKKEGGEEAEVIAEPEVKAADDKKPDVVEPPVNWKAEDKDAFKKLAPEAQKILINRQREMDADYTRKTQAIAALKNEYEPVDKMFEPYRDVMKQKGFTPRTLIEAWSNVEKRLTENPLEVIAGLVGGYKVDTAKLAQRLGIKAAAPTAEGEQPAEQKTFELPPEVQQKLAELDQIKQQVSGLTQAQQRQVEAARNAQETKVQTEIEEFKGAKDDKGTLLHPHFDDVELHMTQLAHAAAVAKQPVPSLKELYETAVWANPSTREKLRTAETQQAEQKRIADARAKAAAAKKASSSVTGAPGPGQAINQGSRSDKSLREQLEEAAEDSVSAA